MASNRERRIRYAQNFLHNRRLAIRLVGRSEIGPGDVVLEIGPGRGIITDALAARCSHLLAIEKDVEYALQLGERYCQQPNVTIFAGDFLEFPLPVTHYKVFASIPFNITARIVAKLTSGISPPVESFLIVQREAAERFIGIPEETLVAIQIKPWFSLSIAYAFHREDFKPLPSVDSVLLRIEHRQEPLLPARDRARFDDLTAALFSAWQPTVAAGLRFLLPRDAYRHLPTDIVTKFERKPSEMTIEDWLELFGVLTLLSSNAVWARIGGRARVMREHQAALRKEHRTRRRG